MDAGAPLRPESWLAHASWMRKLAGHLVADPADVDDVVQDACVAAWQRFGSEGAAAEEERPLQPWLARVVRNLASKRRRSAARRGAHEERRTPLASVPTPAETAQRLDLQRILVDEVSALEEPLRTTILLRFFEDRTSAAIAAAAGVPEGTVRWRVSRGLAELRLRLDRRLDGREAWSALFLPFAELPVPTALAQPAHAPGSNPIAVASQSTLVSTGVQGVVWMTVLAKTLAAAGVLTVVAAVWWSLQDPGRGRAAETAAKEPSAALVEPPPVAVPALLAHGVRESASEEAADVAPSAEAPAPAPAPASDVSSVPPARVDVRFVDREGAAWEGVRFEYRDYERPRETTSARDGRAELELPWTWSAEQPVAQTTFVAHRPGSATVVLHASVSPGTTTDLGDVVLGPGARVLGRIVDVQGTLDLAGAKVGLSASEMPEDDPDRRARHGSEAFEEWVTTGIERDGAFVLEGVAPGRWRLWAHAEGARYAWTEPFDVAEGMDTAGIEIELFALRAEDRIAGVVLDPDGNPVSHADLTFAYSLESESGTTTHNTDDHGRFDELIWRDAIHAIVASDPEGRFDSAVVEGVEPGTLDLEIRLRRKSFLDVSLKGSDGRLVEDAAFQVSVHAEGARISEEVAGERTSGGLYRLSKPQLAFDLDVLAPGWRPRSLSDLDPASIQPPLEIVLEPARMLRGRVVCNGEPAGGARVLLRRRLKGERVLWNGFECLVEPRVLAQVTCDADGRFELPCEVDTEVVVRATGTGLAPAEIGPLDPTRNHGELELELTRGGTLEGRVLVDEGQSAEGIIVGINRGDVAPRTLRTGSGGTFRFEGLTPGPWQVLVRESELEPGGTTIQSNSGDDVSELEELEWSCEVRAGRTTLHDLDLRRR